MSREISYDIRSGPSQNFEVPLLHAAPANLPGSCVTHPNSHKCCVVEPARWTSIVWCRHSSHGCKCPVPKGFLEPRLWKGALSKLATMGQNRSQTDWEPQIRKWPTKLGQEELG